jgi:hypothetical protein
MEKIKLYLINNLLNKLNPQKKFSFSLRFSLIGGMINPLTFFILYVIYYGSRFPESVNGTNFLPAVLLFSVLPVIISFILLRYYYKVDFKWKDYIIMGLLISFISNLPLILINILLDINGYEENIPFILFYTIFISVISGIFFEKTSVKIKLKRILSVILFVWVLYKLIKPFIGGGDDEDESGIDTDGDGIKDSFDTDGDGKIDTTFVDTDGDGISDTIAQDTDGDGLIDTVSSDTDGDGLIDTVVADTDGDGLTDTIIKDVDIDGDGQSDFRITKRKGKGLT